MSEFQTGKPQDVVAASEQSSRYPWKVGYHVCCDLQPLRPRQAKRIPIGKSLKSEANKNYVFGRRVFFDADERTSQTKDIIKPNRTDILRGEPGVQYADELRTRLDRTASHHSSRAAQMLVSEVLVLLLCTFV